MKISRVELRRIALPLVTPFRTSFGTSLARDAVLVRVVTPEAEGWGECVAMPEPSYSSEYASGAAEVIGRFLLPLLSGEVDAHTAEQRMARVRGHRMAKAALGMAVLDAQLRAAGMSFGSYLGATRDRVPAGVSVGIMTSIAELLDTVDGYLAQGYQRIKLKIEPGWDIQPVARVRERFGDIPLQVDANAAYELADARHLAQLDAFGLLLVEQPLPEEDLRGHAALAQRMTTPICLDESIVSARAAADAIALGATSVVNVKPGRVGGYLEARRVHDVCQAHGVPVWAGGMLETGIGRAANIALAALPGFTLPGDTSASDRYYERDVTQPFELDEGHVTVPAGPGLGVTPDMDFLDEITTAREWLEV
ncbi:o-succinylbenzoate synthase [Longispora albida]|uniref:o-succinylbenzoate synthase n=1 Tax=Longispora albida TaxID=203523 RepID=UPI00035D282C|nr:o-succinylbenzoate synthase [Longispora albida]